MRSGDTLGALVAGTHRFAGIAAGLLTIIGRASPQVLLLLIAAGAIVTGVMEAAGAIALRKEIEGEIFLILAGLVSIGFGVMLRLLPVAARSGLVSADRACSRSWAVRPMSGRAAAPEVAG